MRAEIRATVFERLRRALDAGDPLPPASTRLSTDRYTDPAELTRELASLFRTAPQPVAHASELAEVGAWRTSRLGDLGVVAVRADDGIRVFVNACRHRGAELVTADTGRAKALICPYHAWSYRLDGALLHIPARTCFGDLTPESAGLLPLPSALRHGFVWATAAGACDVGAFLGPDIDDDLAAFGLDAYRVEAAAVHERAANWKLVMDAFAEGYHVNALHRTTLARFFQEGSLVDDFAPHVRQVGARRDLAERAEDFDLRSQTTVFYNLFPNGVLVFHPTWISHLTLQPLAADRVTVVHRMLAPAGADAEAEEARAARARSFALIDGSVFQAEDLAIAESIQRTLRSGRQREVVLGTREEGMRLFHRARDAWMAHTEQRRRGGW